MAVFMKVVPEDVSTVPLEVKVLKGPQLTAMKQIDYKLMIVCNNYIMHFNSIIITQYYNQ